jgi:hypothetical protein
MRSSRRALHKLHVGGKTLQDMPLAYPEIDSKEMDSTELEDSGSD